MKNLSPYTFIKETIHPQKSLWKREEMDLLSLLLFAKHPLYGPPYLIRTYPWIIFDGLFEYYGMTISDSLVQKSWASRKHLQDYDHFFQKILNDHPAIEQISREYSLSLFLFDQVIQAIESDYHYFCQTWVYSIFSSDLQKIQPSFLNSVWKQIKDDFSHQPVVIIDEIEDALKVLSQKNLRLKDSHVFDRDLFPQILIRDESSHQKFLLPTDRSVILVSSELYDYFLKILIQRVGGSSDYWNVIWSYYWISHSKTNHYLYENITSLFQNCEEYESNEKIQTLSFHHGENSLFFFNKPDHELSRYNTASEHKTLFENLSSQEDLKVLSGIKEIISFSFLSETEQSWVISSLLVWLSLHQKERIDCYQGLIQAQSYQLILELLSGLDDPNITVILEKVDDLRDDEFIVAELQHQMMLYLLSLDLYHLEKLLCQAEQYRLKSRMIERFYTELVQKMLESAPQSMSCIISLLIAKNFQNETLLKLLSRQLERVEEPSTEKAEPSFYDVERTPPMLLSRPTSFSRKKLPQPNFS